MDEKTMTCPKCGAPRMQKPAQPRPAQQRPVQQKPMQQKTVQQPTPVATQPQGNAKNEKPKKNPWKAVAIAAIAIILVIAIVLGVIFVPDLIEKSKNGANDGQKGGMNSSQSSQVDNRTPEEKLAAAIGNTIFCSEEIEVSFTADAEKWAKSSYYMSLMVTIATNMSPLGFEEGTDGSYEENANNSYEETNLAVSGNYRLVFGDSVDTFYMKSVGGMGADDKSVLTVENGMVYETDGTSYSLSQIWSELEKNYSQGFGVDFDVDTIVDDVLNGTVDEKALKDAYNTYLIPVLEQLISELQGDTSVNGLNAKVFIQHLVTICEKAIKNGDITIKEVKTDNGTAEYAVGFNLIALLRTAVHYIAENDDLAPLLEKLFFTYSNKDYTAEEIVEDFEETFSEESLKQVGNEGIDSIVATREYRFVVDNNRISSVSIGMDGENLVTYTITSK